MQSQQLVQFENDLALAMLQAVQQDKTIHTVLKEVSNILIKKVLQPLQKAVSQVKTFADLPKTHQDLLNKLIAEHVAQGRQYGAMWPQFATTADVTQSIETVVKFLREQEQQLLNLDTMKNIEESAKVLKTILELCFTYFEANEWHSKEFSLIKEFIFPTVEETDIRIMRTDLGEPAQLATTFGIGTNAEDLAPAQLGQGRSAGKSVFGAVSMTKRLEVICRQYDQEGKGKDKMEYYRIPLNPSERQPLAFYAEKWETFFEKLVKSQPSSPRKRGSANPQTNASLPLIASVSRATARILVALQDLQAFNQADGRFDFTKAQLIANCAMAFLIQGGHHSFVEVAETYNRLLDYVAITHLDKHGHADDMTERTMPYYRLGKRIKDYHSFFSQSTRVTIATNTIAIINDRSNKLTA